MNNQDQQHKKTDGSSSENGNLENEKNEQQHLQNIIDDDASSRLRDEDKEALEPQINSEGEFTNRTGWVREEGLSDQERREAEEEGLDGLRSGDSSAL